MAQDETLAALEQGIRDLTTSDRWAAWLSTAAKFHRYSFGNQLLIALQCPTATQVAGYRAWQGMARQVRKGEHGIRILAPMTKKDKETGETKVFGFRGVSVFDIEQTDGEPLPEIVSNLGGEGPRGAWSALVDYAATIGFRVELEEIQSDTNGYCTHSAHRIAVKASNDPAMRVKTLAHEIGHALMHENTKPGDPIARPLAELEAESVAFVVCGALGLDTSGYSFGYVASWVQDGDKAAEVIKKCGARITGAAKKILDGIGAAAETEEAEAA